MSQGKGIITEEKTQPGELTSLSGPRYLNIVFDIQKLCFMNAKCFEVGRNVFIFLDIEIAWAFTPCEAKPSTVGFAYWITTF